MELLSFLAWAVVFSESLMDLWSRFPTSYFFSLHIYMIDAYTNWNAYINAIWHVIVLILVPSLTVCWSLYLANILLATISTCWNIHYSNIHQLESLSINPYARHKIQQKRGTSSHKYDAQIIHTAQLQSNMKHREIHENPFAVPGLMETF